ncbi:SDR family NAD(P)-dependent oxidoreductase, partial [Acinetobacter baumannii]
VYLGGRDETRLAELARDLGGKRFRPFPIDLASLASIEKASAHLRNETDHIDLFFANAGVMATERSTTVDGFETQIGVNHLGHFALTAHLMPL